MKLLSQDLSINKQNERKQTSRTDINIWLRRGLGIGAIVSFLWIVLMRWIAGIIVWTTLLGLIGLLSFGVWYCYDEWNVRKITLQLKV